MSSFFASPASLRMRELPAVVLAAWQQHRNSTAAFTTLQQQMPATVGSSDWMSAANASLALEILKKGGKGGGGGGTGPNFLNLAGLVSEAVLEVVFVALPGYLVAVTGMFDANSQKFVAELNTMVFTPCLIFTKLASQLNADKLADLVVIPFIFLAQTLVSYLCAQLMARAFGFWGKKMRRQKNFVLAMAVFGNSNSLPISLVISLSKTIQGLHWDQVPGDNDDEVAARGILYLLIFQQLGQLLRWTWGYSVLLKPAEAYDDDERNDIEEIRGIESGRYRDDPEDEESAVAVHAGQNVIKPSKSTDSGFTSGFNSGNATPNGRHTDSEEETPVDATPTNGNVVTREPQILPEDSTLLPNDAEDEYVPETDSKVPAWRKPLHHAKHTLVLSSRKVAVTVRTCTHNTLRRLPRPVATVLRTLGRWLAAFARGVWRQMNPPLWAMLAALLVASIPPLQKAFFTRGTFLSNSVTRAISQTGGVAVPLILVVLGANLARSTLPADQLATTPAARREERRLLFASVLARMVLPIVVMAPLLALAAKFVPVSILDDPIFIIVCFLLTGAPSALQLAQICQINNVFMGAMSSLLVASYVVMIFPSTLLLVLLALEVLRWAVFDH